MFVHKVVKPARYFDNSLLENLRAMNGIHFMNEVVIRDVTWFLQFLKHCNGTCSYIYTPLQCNDLIELDTCLTGIGGRYKDTNTNLQTMRSVVHIPLST